MDIIDGRLEVGPGGDEHTKGRERKKVLSKRKGRLQIEPKPTTGEQEDTFLFTRIVTVFTESGQKDRCSREVLFL